MLRTLYGAGLRVGEVCALVPADIDSQRMLLRVCGGTGNKDRYVMLSTRLLATLRESWRLRPPRSHPTDVHTWRAVRRTSSSSPGPASTTSSAVTSRVLTTEHHTPAGEAKGSDTTGSGRMVRPDPDDYDSLPRQTTTGT